MSHIGWSSPHLARSIDGMRVFGYSAPFFAPTQALAVTLFVLRAAIPRVMVVVVVVVVVRLVGAKQVVGVALSFAQRALVSGEHK